MTTEEKLKLLDLIKKETPGWHIADYLMHECGLSWQEASETRAKAVDYLKTLKNK